MADFVKKHKRNNRFTVNRDQRIYIKCSQTERDMWLSLVNVLQDRRNTGPQIETFVYLVKKYNKIIKLGRVTKRNGWKTVDRDKGILLKVNAAEKLEWIKLVSAFDSSQTETFMHIVDKEYSFQDNEEVIIEK